MRWRAFFKFLVYVSVVVCLLWIPTWAWAHSIVVVNGQKDANEWLDGFGTGSCPNLPASNSSGVYQGPPCNGPTGSEFIWTDATGDQRTDHWGGTGNLDLVQFRMTGDLSNINFLLEFADITDCNAQYVAIAIDNKLVVQGTNTWFPDFGDTQTPFAFEYVIEANTSNTGYWDKDYNFTSAGTSFCDATTNLWEIQMPATALGMTWPASTGDYNFAVAIFCHDGSGGICNVSDGSVSDAMDVITTTGPNTWDEVSDQHLGYQFTAGFGPTAVTLQTLRAERSPTHSRVLTLALSGLLALAGGVLLVRTRRRV